MNTAISLRLENLIYKSSYFKRAVVPGYIDENEVRHIARFIASINPDIPYSMLAFYPHFYMSYMPLTPKVLAEGCRRVVQEEGLKNMRIGNVHFLV